MKPLKIACVGEAMIEMVVDDKISHADLTVAGDTMNTAVYLKRCLGPQHEVAFVTMLGNDRFSDRIEKSLCAEQISTNYIRRHPERIPGIYSIATDENGERSFSYWRDMSAAKLMFSLPHGLSFDQLDAFDVLFVSAITLAILPEADRERFLKWIETFRQGGGRFVFDSNYRPALWPNKTVAKREIEKAWSLCDIALPSIDDEMALFGETSKEAVLNRFNQYRISAGVLKCGELGPVPICGEEGEAPMFSKAGKVVDTTAAGDSFNGGFLAAYLTTGDLYRSMKSGHDLANKVIGHHGAILPR